MCGIAGLVTPDGPPDRHLIEAMTQTLHRRGPDDTGMYVDPDGGCALGHRRLSIIDLETGHQPLGTTDGVVQGVVNGEIYNYRALREELRQLGHSFSTNSDSEVVIHGFRAWGEGLVSRLEGMFALAVWDASRQILLLARDRMGQKPLYYYPLASEGKVGVVFGSEAKALFIHPEVSREPTAHGLSHYLCYEFLPEDLCLTKGMAKLRPGEYLVLDRRRAKMTSQFYWQMRFSGSPALFETARLRKPKFLANALRERILASVEARLISDVPLGVFLSGGVDSSLVTAAMAQMRPPDSIKTFAIAFDDPTYDESSYARLVAKHLGTVHQEQRLSGDKMVDMLPEIADFMCEPLADASLIPTYLLSKFTRGEVKVALGGDGGDELFLGYDTFFGHRLAQLIDHTLPLDWHEPFGNLASSAAGLLPFSQKYLSLDFKVKRFSMGLGFSPEKRQQAWIGSFRPFELPKLLNPDFAREVPNPYDVIDQLHLEPLASVSERDKTRRFDARDFFDRITLQYSRLFLTSGVLVKVDRASMACGLEVRAPLLDRQIVEFACAVPSKLKLRGATTKYLLKEAARPWLPSQIIDRKKHGFSIPIASWLRGPLRPMGEELLSWGRLERQGYFNPAPVRAMWREHISGQVDHRKTLWTLLAFQLWYDRHGPGRTP